MTQMVWCLLCCLTLYTGLSVSAEAQKIEDKYFVGKWVLTEPDVEKAITTVEMSKDGGYKGGAWGRNYGGPNGIGATRYRAEKAGELVFYYKKPGGGRTSC